MYDLICLKGGVESVVQLPCDGPTAVEMRVCVYGRIERYLLVEVHGVASGVVVFVVAVYKNGEILLCEVGPCLRSM